MACLYPISSVSIITIFGPDGLVYLGHSCIVRAFNPYGGFLINMSQVVPTIGLKNSSFRNCALCVKVTASGGIRGKYRAKQHQKSIHHPSHPLPAGCSHSRVHFPATNDRLRVFPRVFQTVHRQRYRRGHSQDSSQDSSQDFPFFSRL